MAKTHVHIIEADLKGNVYEVMENREKLGRAVATLAQEQGADIYFHDFKEPLAGAPVLLVECSEDFLKKIEKLDGFKKSYDLWEDVETERSPRLAAHFSGSAAPAASRTPPKKPPRFGM